MLSQEVHESQKFALMEAVVKSIAKYGIENTSARTIGALSNVKEVYIYRYFEDKDDLLDKTFSFADERFLKYFLDNFPQTELENGELKHCLRVFFDKIWDYIYSHPDWLLFYARYYYSHSFQKYSYENHTKRCEVLLEKATLLCTDKESAKFALQSIRNIILGQAADITAHDLDSTRFADDTFAILCVILQCGEET